jgi:hypothetical protein
MRYTTIDPHKDKAGFEHTAICMHYTIDPKKGKDSNPPMTRQKSNIRTHKLTTMHYTTIDLQKSKIRTQDHRSTPLV